MCTVWSRSLHWKILQKIPIHAGSINECSFLSQFNKTSSDQTPTRFMYMLSCCSLWCQSMIACLAPNTIYIPINISLSFSRKLYIASQYINQWWMIWQFVCIDRVHSSVWNVWRMQKYNNNTMKGWQSEDLFLSWTVILEILEGHSIDSSRILGMECARGVSIDWIEWVGGCSGCCYDKYFCLWPSNHIRVECKINADNIVDHKYVSGQWTARGELRIFIVACNEWHDYQHHRMMGLVEWWGQLSCFWLSVTTLVELFAKYIVNLWRQ